MKTASGNESGRACGGYFSRLTYRHGRRLGAQSGDTIHARQRAHCRTTAMGQGSCQSCLSEHLRAPGRWMIRAFGFCVSVMTPGLGGHGFLLGFF
jgi:hypothetical protein